jgi:uncharacterized protein YfiM (DUF2279 family)
MKLPWNYIVILSIIFPINVDSILAQSDTTKSVVIKSREKINKQPFQINQTDSWIGKDKADHFIVSAMLCAGCLHVARAENNLSENQSLFFSIGFPLTIGIVKEVWDAFQPNHVASVKDVCADIAGIGVGYVLFNE